MPGASTPTFAYKIQNIGMNLHARYRVPYAHQGIPIANNNIDSISDPKRHNACCNIRYDQLLDTDVDPQREAELIAQFPRFNNRIHHLVEERREFRLRQNQDPDPNKCTIL